MLQLPQSANNLIHYWKEASIKYTAALTVLNDILQLTTQIYITLIALQWCKSSVCAESMLTILIF